MSFTLPLRPAAQCTRLSISRAFSATTSAQMQYREVPRKRRRDAYAVEQAKARKAANASRQQTLAKERKENLGDPVRGITTPFIKSLDNPVNSEAPSHHNHFVKLDELSSTLERSKKLLMPPKENSRRGLLLEDGPTAEERSKAFEDGTVTAEQAMRRIVEIGLGSSKDRRRINFERCIDTFGRHKTDSALPLRPGMEGKEVQLRQRAGPDTGSTEVQVAILTTRIRAMAESIASRGKHDHHNKHKLRILVHRRQRLLQYLRRKERAGPRWTNLIETLGLTEGTWKGEITLARHPVTLEA